VDIQRGRPCLRWPFGQQVTCRVILNSEGERVRSFFEPRGCSGSPDLARLQHGTRHLSGDGAVSPPPEIVPGLSNSAEYVSVRPGPSRGTHRSLALVARHIFIDASGPETAPCDFSASEVEPRSCCGLERPPRLGSKVYAAMPQWRLRWYFSTSNGWPVRITSKSTGTIFRATALTAFVRQLPLRSHMAT
jgi:hypothetical protein